jgi:tetratricopeptide (TPR) repeat protein
MRAQPHDDTCWKSRGQVLPANTRAWAGRPVSDLDAVDDDTVAVRGVHNTLGSVHGASVQAGAVYGGIHVTVGSRGFPPPRQLPMPSRRFVNRNNELAHLDGVLDSGLGSGPTVILVTGLAGVGKSALALTALSRWGERFPDGQLYADLTHPGEIAPADVLGQFLRAFGVAADQVPASDAERASLWRTFTTNRNIAVLLEAPASTAQVWPLLPASRHGLTVVTSQRPLHGLLAEGAHWVSVEPLDATASLALLHCHLHPEQLTHDQSPARELAQMCGGLPLALAVAARQAARRPHRPLSHTVTVLQRARSRVEVLSMPGDLSIQASFDAAYRTLTEPAAQTYRVLGLNCGEGFSLELAAAAMNSDLAAAENALDDLVDASLLDVQDEDRYRFHSLVHEHARRMAETHDPESRGDVLERILRWYLHVTGAAAATVMAARRTLVDAFAPTTPPYFMPAGMDDYVTALTWLDRERRNLGAAVREAARSGFTQLAVLLADAMQPLAILHHDVHDTIAIDEIALRAAIAVGDPATITSIRKRLARYYAGLRDFARAQEYVDATLRDTRTRQDGRGYASALKSQAMLHVAAGKPAAAVDYYDQAVCILRELGAQRSEALALINFAEALLSLGGPAAASEHLDRARLLLSTLAKTDPYNTARVDLTMARVRLATGDLAAANASAAAALAMMTSLRSRHEQANAHTVLADIADAMGDQHLAGQHRATAKELRLVTAPVEQAAALHDQEVRRSL